MIVSLLVHNLYHVHTTYRFDLGQNTQIFGLKGFLLYNYANDEIDSACIYTWTSVKSRLKVSLYNYVI